MDPHFCELIAAWIGFAAGWVLSSVLREDEDDERE